MRKSLPCPRPEQKGLSSQRGLTLVELMVGLAIGLFIVSTALGLVLAQIRDDRALLQESRLRISLQAASDMVAHDLRRAGFRGDAGIAVARSTRAALPDPYAAIDWSDTDATLKLSFSMDASENQTVDGNEQFGFRLRGGVLEAQIGSGGWQAVTEAATMTVTAFGVTPVVEEIPLGSFCTQPCPASDAACPRQQVRRFDLTLAAHSATDAFITRTLNTSVRVRNDLVTGTCPA